MSGNSAAAAAANAHLMQQFNPLYMYQLQMAHQALGKKSCKSKQSLFHSQCETFKRNCRQRLYAEKTNASISFAASSKNNMQNVNFNDIQRLAEIQRQYLLELTQHQQQASGSSSRQNNWKP